MSCRAIVVFLLLLFTAHAVAGEPVVTGQSYGLRSQVLNEDRSYQVALPASYAWAKDRRYPVLLVLDGPEHFAHTSGSVAYLAKSGEIPEMIVVALASTVRVRDFTPTDWERWVGGGGAGNFKRFLASELLPAIDTQFRTDGFRVLSGHSAGGGYVLYNLSAEPALFQGYIALSPSLDWDNGLPRRDLEKSFLATKRLPAFLYFAWSDDAGRDLALDEQPVATLKAHAPTGFRWEAKGYPQETHGSIALVGQIDGLRALYSGYRLHNDLLDKGLPYAEQHFAAVSTRLGHTIPVPEDVLNSFGYAALEQGEQDEAIAIFLRVVAASPNSANAYDSLADGYASAKRWPEAAQAADRALALATEYKLDNRDYFERQAKKMHGHLQDAPPR